MRNSGFALRRRELVLPGGIAPLTGIAARTGVAHAFELFREVVELLVGRDGVVLLTGQVEWRELRQRFRDVPPAEFGRLSRWTSTARWRRRPSALFDYGNGDNSSSGSPGTSRC